MTINEKVINYKILDLVKLYSFGTNFVFIQYHMKKLPTFFAWDICRGKSGHYPPLKVIFRAGEAITRPWKWSLFSEVGDGITYP